ncbi:MAG: AMP-binding protein, partial [Coriobacteriales bacterium]|nr:AMP-binding protein [Coriobacteriales bacterium]
MSKLVREFIDQNCGECPELDAIRWLQKKDVKSLTYGELLDETTAIRKGIVAEGFDHTQISLIGTTSVSWICSYLGIITGTCAAVPLDPQMPVADLIPLVNRSDSTALFLGKKCVGMLPALLAGCPQLRKVWIMEGERPECDDERVETIAELKAQATDADVMPTHDDLAMIIFTSGTTGLAKGVMLSQHNLAENVAALSFKTGRSVPLLNVLPIHHAFCLVMDWLRG